MLQPDPSGIARPRAPWARTLPVLLCLLLAVVLPARAEAAPKLPTQGMYDTCLPEKSRDGCASRLRRLSNTGFKVVVPRGIESNVESLPNVLSYAATAQASGLKVIWHLRPELSDAELHEVVTALRTQPSTWGYYIFDEPGLTQRDKVAAFSARVKALDPSHPRLVMGCGVCYGGERSVSFLSGLGLTLGTDMYPVAEQAPDQPGVARRVEAAAAGLRRVADRDGAQTVMTLQAWRWGDSHYDSQSSGIGPASRFPTRREIEDQRNAAIKGAHPDLILWFMLNQTIGWEPGQRPWYWAEPSDPGVRWSNLVRGAFAPLPTEKGANKRPVARFTLRTRRASRVVRVFMNGKRSYDPDGRIARYRWYTSGRRKAVCGKQRCWMTLRGGRARKLKLVVTDRHGARSSKARWIGKRRR